MMLVPQTIAGCCIAIHIAGGSIQGAHASTCVHVHTCTCDTTLSEGLTFFLVKSVKTGRSLERELLNLANVSFHTLFIACIADLTILKWHLRSASSLYDHDDVMFYSI